jgi:hypothetical protein
MKINLILLFMSILLLPYAFSDIYQSNTTITLYSDLYNGSLQYLPSNSSVVTYITDENNSVINFGTMTLQSGTGGIKWAYNTTILLDGDYYRLTQYISNATVIAESSETFRIVTNINNIAQDTSDVVQTIFATFIVFLVGLLIAILAKYLREPSFYYFSSVYFIGSSAYMYFDGQGWSFPMFFALFGILIAYKGVSEHISDWEAKQKEKERNTYDEIE